MQLLPEAEDDTLWGYRRRRREGGTLSNLEKVHQELLVMKSLGLVGDVEECPAMINARRGEFVFIEDYCGA